MPRRIWFAVAALLLPFLPGCTKDVRTQDGQLASEERSSAEAQRNRGERRGRGNRRRPKGPPPEIGTVLADFALQDVEGNTVRLSDFRGKIFALELGACT